MKSEMHVSEERDCVPSTQDRDDVGPDSTATSYKIEEERDCLPSQTPTLNGHDYLYSGPEATAEEMLEAAQQRIRELEAALEKTSLSVRFQLKPDNLIRFYTGFPSYQVLITTFFFCGPPLKKCIRGHKCKDYVTRILQKSTS